MTTRMLIDARHREETRVAVIKGNRIEEFDFESAEHKQLKGNIYLAKVTRVEPSLQAAFVEYGGNRHGFLAFSEIHPDYYQIPKEDREALLREEAELAAENAAMRADEEMDALEGEVEDIRPPAPLDEEGEESDLDGQSAADGDEDGDDEGRETSDSEPRERGQRGRRRGRGRDREDRGERDEGADFRRSLHRRYKIQDVIRRRQVLLVQVVKEERGTKGAALTTYLSLAGRYCVLMPNSSHGGGISRKISNGSDRKRLKSIIDDLNLPPTMGCIVRTAGLERTKTEIKRDFDYLARLWDGIRETTLSSSAPALIHSDSDLIKRAIRDIYNSDIDEVSVEGEDGYRAAKDFMKLLMPSHARKVKQYADPVSLFQRYGVEDQLGAMYQPLVGLKSGGYLVINPTEALVSIDINSGRSTREHNIEQTAVNTNLEAAYEIARQLRLRDMAGLVVIDFIDMEVGSNVRKVERAMKDALKNDRARIQVGRISGFGLMEMSRQRLRTGVLEASTRACPHCEGTGLVRTASSAGLSALRLLEEEAARGRGTRLLLRASQEAAFYVLNQKRSELGEIEDRYGVRIAVQSDGETEGARMAVESSGPPPENRPRFETIIDTSDDEDDAAIALIEDGDDDMDSPAQRHGEQGDERGDRPRRRRGRRRRGGRREEGEQEQQTQDAADEAAGDIAEDGDERAGDAEAAREQGDEGDRRRRRGRRGGRGRREGTNGHAGAEGEAAESVEAIVTDEPVADDAPVGAEVIALEDSASEAPAKAPRRRRKAAADPVEATETVDAPAAEAPAKPARASRARKAAAPAPESADAEAPAKPRRTRKAASAAAPVEAPEAEAPAVTEPVAVAAMTDEPDPVVVAETASANGGDGERRRGWWQRTFGA